MAFRWIHVLRVYDENRNGFFYLYRFPYSEDINDKLKKAIPQKKDRFFYPKTKAWHVAEKYANEAERIIRYHTKLGVCRVCRSGTTCKAWTHIHGSAWMDGATTPQEEHPWEHVCDDESYYEDVQSEWEPPDDQPFYGHFHRETDEERYRAQERYQQWVNEQAARRSQQQAEGRAWQEAQRRQAQERARQESERQRQFYESLFGTQEPPPTGDQRWYDPGKRRDSKWAMMVMGLTRLPTKAELKAVFRKLVMTYHPDRPDGSHEKMALINSARDYLDAFIE